MEPPGAGHPLRRTAGAAAVFSGLLALYGATACRTIGPGDSGELTVAMSTWGVPHAPGYPLLCLLGNCITLLVGRDHAATALNLLNAVFAAGAATCVMLAVIALNGNRWAGVVAGLALGLSPAFWTQALAVEVVSLNAFVAGLMLYFFSRLLAERERGRVANGALVGLAVCLTTAVTHHATIVLLGLPIAIVCAWTARTGHRVERADPGRFPLTAAIATSLFVGALPLLYLPLAAGHDPPLNWGNPTTLSALAHVLLRGDFGVGVLIAPPITAGEILQHGESVDPAGGKHLWLFLSQLPRHLGWCLVLCALFEVLDALRRRRAMAVVILLFAFSQIIFFLKVNTPLTPLYLQATERFYVLPETFVAFLGGIGLANVASRLGPRVRNAGLLVVLITAAESLGWNVATRPIPDMHLNTFTGDLGRNLLTGMPENALAFTDGDMFRNSALFAQVDAGFRPDAHVVDPVLMAAPWYVSQLRRRHTMVLPDTMTVYSGAPGTDSKAWIDLNLGNTGTTERDGRPVVAVRMNDESWRSSYQMVPMGLWSEAIRRGATPRFSDWCRRFSQVVAGWRLESIAQLHPPGSWEYSQSVFYRYGLACLQAVREMAAEYEPERATRDKVPALELAEHWQGADRADFLAYQGDLWKSCLEDSLVPGTAGARRRAFERAAELSEQALAADSTNVQALQTLAWSKAASGDVAAEVRLRHRIVRVHPGDTAELTAYFASVARAREGRVAGYAEIWMDAERVRERAQHVVQAAEAHWFDPRLARFRQQLSVPIPR